MKRIILSSFMVLAFLISGNAQNILDDFFKSLPSKGSQNDTIGKNKEHDSIPYIKPIGNNNEKKDNSTNIVVSATMLDSILKSTFVLRQDYCLYNKWEKAYYVYEDDEQFGTTYSIGIKCNGYNIVSDRAICPWNYDEKYGYYEKKKNLAPIITKSWYKYCNDSVTLAYSQLDTVVTAKKTIKDGAYYTASPFISYQTGLSINNQDTCKVGTIVWFVIEKGDIASADFKLGLVSNSIKTEMFGSKPVTPPGNKRVLGGIFITQTQNSESSFQIAGMLTQKNNDWVLEFPFKGYTNSVKTTPKKIGKLKKIKSISKKK